MYRRIFHLFLAVQLPGIAHATDLPATAIPNDEFECSGIIFGDEQCVNGEFARSLAEAQGDTYLFFFECEDENGEPDYIDCLNLAVRTPDDINTVYTLEIASHCEQPVGPPQSPGNDKRQNEDKEEETGGNFLPQTPSTQLPPLSLVCYGDYAAVLMNESTGAYWPLDNGGTFVQTETMYVPWQGEWLQAHQTIHQTVYTNDNGTERWNSSFWAMDGLGNYIDHEVVSATLIEQDSAEVGESDTTVEDFCKNAVDLTFNKGMIPWNVIFHSIDQVEDAVMCRTEEWNAGIGLGGGAISVDGAGLEGMSGSWNQSMKIRPCKEGAKVGTIKREAYYITETAMCQRNPELYWHANDLSEYMEPPQLTEEIELVQEIEVGGLTLDGDGECDLENGEVTVAEDVQFTTDDGTYCSYDYFMDCNTLSCSCGSISPFLEIIVVVGEDELGECPDDPMNPSD